MNKKLILIILIIIIVTGSIYLRPKNEATKDEGLLSPRIYQGILKEESKLLFNFDPLEEAIGSYISKKTGTVSVYVLNARDGSVLSINNDLEYEPASFNKLPLAITILNKVERGELKLDTLLEIKKEDLDKASGELYKHENEKLTIDQLIEEMLVNSDNTAFKVLNEQVTTEEINKLSYYLDYYQYNPKSQYYSINAESNVRLFSSLYLSTILKKENSEKILNYLLNANFDIHKISGIPSDVKIAHKFANFYNNNEKYFHECGIIYIENSRIIYCIMTNGMSGLEAEQTIGTIMHSIYEYVIKAKQQTIEDNLV
jgi:beta-lactamase class A